ncbi:hypothetical protein BDY24DRAFT_348512 [Mrakia frigida]|uniref:uncharacterized protein n=1 Tax=Mrakia frigida TaxID=29902 RepID=UPI003FCC13D8
MAAIYTVFTSPYHAPIPDHLPTLVVTPHGQPTHVLYSYLHTDFNRINYLLTPSPQGDLCVAKLFPPRSSPAGASSDPGHSSRESRAVRCEASRELKWSIENTGVRSPIYKIVNSDDTPLYQISKPNPNADFWTMFYFAYAGHQIPPRRAEFGKIQKNPPEKGGGTRITITGKTEDEKRVWQTLGEGNEDCVEWVVCCAALNLLDDEILKAAGQSNPSSRSGPPPSSSNPIASSSSPSIASSNQPPQNLAQPPPRPGQAPPAPSPRLANSRPQQLHDPGPVPGARPVPSRMGSSSSTSSRNPPPPQQQQNGSGLRPQQPPRSASAQSAYTNGGGPSQQQQQQEMRPGQQPDPRLDPRGGGGGRPPQQQQGYDPRAPPPQSQQGQQQYDPRYGPPPPGQQQHQQQRGPPPPQQQQQQQSRGRF